MAWKRGPLPQFSYGYGAVQAVGQRKPTFYFAAFRGDHVKTYPGGKILTACQIAYYDVQWDSPAVLVGDDKGGKGEGE